MRLRIVLLPDQAGDALSKRISVEIAEKLAADFVLDDTHIPHVTVLALESEVDVFLLIKVLEETAKKIKHLYGQSKIVVQKSDKSYIGLYFGERLGKEVGEIRKILLDQFATVQGVSNIELDNPAAHLTLTHLKKPEDSKEVSKTWGDLNVQLDLGFLGLAIEGENFGTCKQISKRFKLG